MSDESTDLLSDKVGESSSAAETSGAESATEVNTPDELGESAARPTIVNAVFERLEAIDQQLAEFHRRSAHRESVIDRLHEENVELRTGVRKAILEPIVTDLVRLYDALIAEAIRLGDRPGSQTVASFADDVELILQRCGVEVFVVQAGEVFQPGRHSAAVVLPTDNEALHNTAAEAIGAGLIDSETGRIRRPARARFYRYVDQPDRPVSEPSGPSSVAESQ